MNLPMSKTQMGIVANFLNFDGLSKWSLVSVTIYTNYSNVKDFPDLYFLKDDKTSPGLHFVNISSVNKNES